MTDLWLRDHATIIRQLNELKTQLTSFLPSHKLYPTTNALCFHSSKNHLYNNTQSNNELKVDDK